MKDIKYIFKKVIIGILIGTILIFIRKNVYAVNYNIYNLNPNVYYLSSGGYPNVNSTKTITSINGTRFMTWNSNNNANYGSKIYIPSGLPSGVINVGFLYYNEIIGSPGTTSYEPSITMQYGSCVAHNSVGYRDQSGETTAHGSIYAVICENIEVVNGYANISFFHGNGQNLGLTKFGVSEVWSITKNVSEILEEQNETFQEINKNIQETNNTLKDDSSADNDNITGAINAGSLPGNDGPISAILTMPLNVINHLLTIFGFSCTDMSVPLPFVDTSFTIPCVNKLFEDMGWSTYYEFVGVIAGAVVLYYYLLYLYDRVNHILFLEDKGDLRNYY